MCRVTEVVRRELDLYQEVSEVWKRDHERAMACYNFQDLLEKGIAAFEFSNRVDEAYRRAVLRGEEAFDKAVNDRIAGLFISWIATGREVLRNLEAFERAGFRVEHSDAFRRCCREAEGIVAPPSDFFSDDALVMLRDDAIDAHHRGESSECSI